MDYRRGIGVVLKGADLLTKLDSEEEAQPIVDAIEQCPYLLSFHIEGYLLGVGAAEAIGKMLAKKTELRRLLLNNIFLESSKHEILQSMECLIVRTYLVELDLSDNNLGTDVRGLADLLHSRCCYNLEELRLDNNNLGVRGAKLLAKALLYEAQDGESRVMPLKVLSVANNEIQDGGAMALANVLEGSDMLEELCFDDNKISKEGFLSLREVFKASWRFIRVIQLGGNDIPKSSLISFIPEFLSMPKLNRLKINEFSLETEYPNESLVKAIQALNLNTSKKRQGLENFISKNEHKRFLRVKNVFFKGNFSEGKEFIFVSRAL